MRKHSLIYIFLLLITAILFTANNTVKIANPYIEEVLSSNDFIISEAVNPKILDQYKNSWDLMPDYLKKNVTSVVFTTEKLNGKFNLSEGNDVLAVSYGSDIYINDGKFNPNVLIHELYHVYDYTHGWVSNRYEFKTLYSKYCTNPRINIYEFFSKTGEKFYFEPTSLSAECPELYNYFSNLR